MTKPGDSLTTKKTIHELAKEFPEKSYRELEKYRDADRQEEALGIGGIGHNRPPGEAFKKACTLGEMKKDRSYPDLAEVLVAENDELKKEIKNLKWIKDHDYIFLVDENKKLHKELRELKKDNKKLANEINDRIAQARQSGL